jgi:hypothetical protein
MEKTDYKKRLVEYFKKNLTKSYNSGALKFALINQGYSRIAVEEALVRATAELAEKAPILKEKPIVKYEIIDENDKVVKIKKPFLKRLFDI